MIKVDYYQWSKNTAKYEIFQPSKKFITTREAQNDANQFLKLPDRLCFLFLGRSYASNIYTLYKSKNSKSQTWKEI